jgi:hypothetical protein
LQEEDVITTRVVVILLALAGAALAFGAPAFAARVTAKVYLGSRPVGCLIRYSTGDWDSPTVHLGKHGRDIRATAGMAERVGYARERPGGIWYVNLYGKRPARTIGTVRRVTATLWTAYSGLGARARRVGYAVGRDAAVGAISLMLGSFAQVRRDDMCRLKND